ncbi:MAG: hypothetical protein ACR2OG_13360 [Gemmatimonadaceae bacterium]
MFKTARESAFEQARYDSVAAGMASTADQLERLLQQVGARYSVWFGADSLGRAERTMEWVNALQFFTRPLYRVNYLYAKLLALAYLDRFTRNSASFAPAYAALLRNGYDAPPDVLLHRFLGVGLADPELVRAAHIIDARVAELERLTKEIQ